MFLILYLWLFYLNIWVCARFVPDAQGGQKRASDLLGLELRMVLNHRWRGSWQTNSAIEPSALDHRAITPVPITVRSWHNKPDTLNNQTNKQMSKPKLQKGVWNTPSKIKPRFCKNVKAICYVCKNIHPIMFTEQSQKKIRLARVKWGSRTVVDSWEGGMKLQRGKIHKQDCEVCL